MKKSAYICVIAILVLQIVLSLLRAFGVIGWRWLWVLAPLWLTAAAGILWGIFVSIQKKNSPGSRENLSEENKK